VSVLPSIAVSLTAEQLIGCMDGRLSAARFAGEIDTALRRAEPLIQAAAAFRWVTVSAIGPGSLTVCPDTTRDAHTFETGPGGDPLRFAEKILLCVITIGPDLDRTVRSLNRSRDSLDAYLLDCAGLAALWQTFAAICRLAEKTARCQDMGLGHLVSPGGVAGWPLCTQRAFCELVPLKRIGVRVDDQSVLHPLKSVSGLIPMGRNYRSQTVGSACRYCQCRPYCHQRFQKRQKTMG
jgi:hypothetical protein